MRQLKAIDLIIGLFGYSRAILPQDDHVIDAVLKALRKKDATKCGETGMPTAFDVYYFRVKGRRVQLIVEDWGDVILCGPTRIIRELAADVSETLKSSREANHEA